jgi:hypothetical protein
MTGNSALTASQLPAGEAEGHGVHALRQRLKAATTREDWAGIIVEAEQRMQQPDLPDIIATAYAIILQIARRALADAER